MSSFLALKLFKLKPSWLAWFWADFGFPLTFKCPLSGRVAPMLWWLGDGFLEILMERSSKALVPQLGIYLCMSTLRRWLREQSWWDLRQSIMVCCFTQPQRVGLWVCQCGCWKGPLERHVRDNLMMSLEWLGQQHDNLDDKTHQHVACETSEFRSGSEFHDSIPKPHDQRDEIARGSEPMAALIDRGGFGRLLSLEIQKPEVLSWKRGKNGG